MNSTCGDSCRKSTRFDDGEASALPTAFHINNLLEIDALLVKSNVQGDEVPLCDTHNRPKYLYCETCETHVCSTGSHCGHRCDRSEYLFTKHKDEIQASLQSMKQRIDKIEEILACYDVREKETRDQEEVVQKEIDAANLRLID